MKYLLNYRSQPLIWLWILSFLFILWLCIFKQRVVFCQRWIDDLYDRSSYRYYNHYDRLQFYDLFQELTHKPEGKFGKTCTNLRMLECVKNWRTDSMKKGELLHGSLMLLGLEQEFPKESFKQPCISYLQNCDTFKLPNIWLIPWK